MDQWSEHQSGGVFWETAVGVCMLNGWGWKGPPEVICSSWTDASIVIQNGWYSICHTKILLAEFPWLMDESPEPDIAYLQYLRQYLALTKIKIWIHLALRSRSREGGKFSDLTILPEDLAGWQFLFSFSSFLFFCSFNKHWNPSFPRCMQYLI